MQLYSLLMLSMFSSVYFSPLHHSVCLRTYSKKLCLVYLKFTSTGTLPFYLLNSAILAQYRSNSKNGLSDAICLYSRYHEVFLTSWTRTNPRIFCKVLMKCIVEKWNVFSSSDFSWLLSLNFDKDMISLGEVNVLKFFTYLINLYVILKLKSSQHERYCQVPSKLGMLLSCMACFPNRILWKTAQTLAFFSLLTAHTWHIL